MDTEKLFNDVAHFVADSRALLKEGAVMELAGLEDRVRTLCEQVLMLSQEERIRYADKLQILLGELKVLGDELAVQRDALAQEIKGVSQHKKANVAYRTASGKEPESEE